MYTYTYAYTCKYVPIRRSKFGSRSRTRSCRAGSGVGSDLSSQFRTPPYVIEHQGSESWQRLIYKICICCYWTYIFLSISNQLQHLAQQRATNHRKHLPREPSTPPINQSKANMSKQGSSTVGHLYATPFQLSSEAWLTPPPVRRLPLLPCHLPSSPRRLLQERMQCRFPDQHRSLTPRLDSRCTAYVVPFPFTSTT